MLWMEKIALILGVPVTELLDEYHLFLYHDQGRQVKEKRKSLCMTRAQYAEYLGVPVGTLENWEQNSVRMMKSSWEKYFK